LFTFTGPVRNRQFDLCVRINPFLLLLVSNAHGVKSLHGISLIRMNSRLVFLPERTQRSLKKCLIRRLNDFDDANLLVWLKNNEALGYKWSENLDATSTVFRRIISLYGDKHHINEGTKQFTSIMKHMGVRTKWNDIPEEVKTSFYNGIEQLSTQFDAGDLADLIYGYKYSSE
jgi:hypothetical protein